MERLWPDGPADPDLRRALDDRDRHDVGDPDPAHGQRQQTGEQRHLLAGSCWPGRRLEHIARASASTPGSGPPRLMAVGMALAVAWVVPLTGADVELVGLAVRSRRRASPPTASRTRRCPGRGRAATGPELPDHSEVRRRSAGSSGSRPAGSRTAWRSPTRSRRTWRCCSVSALFEPAPVEHGHLEHGGQAVSRRPGRAPETPRSRCWPPARAAPTTPERFVVAAAAVTVETFSTRSHGVRGEGGVLRTEGPARLGDDQVGAELGELRLQRPLGALGQSHRTHHGRDPDDRARA